MSWSNKVCFFVVPLSLGISVFGQQIQFNAQGDRATIESHLISRGADIGSVEMNLSIPSVNIENTNDGFQSLSIKGLVPTPKVGSPELLTTGQLIAVPEGYVAQVSIIEEAHRDISKVLVRPTQRKFRCSNGRAESFSYNSALYQSDSLFPAEVVTLEEVGKLQNLHLMRVAMTPVQMNFADGSLKITTDLKVRVDFRKTNLEAQTPISLPKSFYRIAKMSTANGQGLGSTVVAEQTPETLVILVADSFKKEISSLVKWKQQRGLNVEVFTLTEAGGTKESIKKFIQQYYDSHEVKPTYLLTIGNKTTMPTYMESTASGSAASDWQYTLLSGNDNIPDLFYGRLVADDEKELTTQIDRWIAYEKAPELGAAWYHDAMTIASPDGSGPSDKEYAEQIQEALKSHTYKFADSFFNSTDTATAANISDAALQGRSWISYFGHGSGTSWASTNDTFSNTEVATLENTKLPFIIDVACQNGSWVKLPKCFGKAWVTQTTKDGKAAGAVAFYGGSVNISWHPPAVMSVGVAKSHFEKGIPSLGGSVLAGQLYLFEKMGTGEDTLDNLKWYNLLGDPSLVMRTDTPAEYQVKKTITRSGDLVKLNLTATDTSGKGVAGLTVSVASSQRGTVAVGKTGADGKSQLSIPSVAASGADTLLTVSGYNAETVQMALLQ